MIPFSSTPLLRAKHDAAALNSARNTGVALRTPLRVSYVAMAQDPTSDLERAVEVLRIHGIRVIVIGGQAEALHGSPRFTQDIARCGFTNCAGTSRSSL